MDYTSHIHRLFRLITHIHGQPHLNAKKLAELCNVGQRTIYRDLVILKDAGIPLSMDPDNGYSIRRDFFLRPLDLTLEEAMALLMLADRVGGDEQIPHLGEAQKAAEKLRAILPRAIANMIHEVLPRTTVSLARAANEPTADVLDTVRAAITNRRALECAYGSPHRAAPDNDVRFRFDPYALYYGQRAWYVVGRHHGHDQIRTLKLGRFSCCKSTQQPYMIPDDFSLATHFGKAWRMMPSGKIYPVKLHFRADVAETVADTHWHDTQQVDEQEDGSAILRFLVDGLDEIVWWVLGYGPSCKVLEPPELAARVQTLHEAAAARYTNDP